MNNIYVSFGELIIKPHPETSDSVETQTEPPPLHGLTKELEKPENASRLIPKLHLVPHDNRKIAQHKIP